MNNNSNRNASNIFDDMGMSVIDATNIMQILGVSHTELGNMEKFAKFKAIAHFVKDIPNKERFFARIPPRIGESKLDLFFNYTQLRLQYEEAIKNKSITEDLLMRSPDDEILREQYDIISSDVADIERTLDVYEN